MPSISIDRPNTGDLKTASCCGAPAVPPRDAEPAAAVAEAFAPTVPNDTPSPGPAPEGMAWIPGGEFSMGCADPTPSTERRRQSHAGCAADPSREGRRILDRPARSHQRRVRAVCGRDRICNGGRAETHRRGVSRRAAGESGGGLRGLHAGKGTRSARQLLQLVAVRAWRGLAASGRPGDEHRRQGELSGGAHRLRGCGGLCVVGGQTPADGSRMGIRGPRRPVGRLVHVGR